MDLNSLAIATSASPRRLRVGVFADARLQPRWVVEALDKVARSDFAEIALIAVAPGAGQGPDLVQSVYQRLDRMAFGDDSSAEPQNLADLLPQRPLIGMQADFHAQELDVAFVLGDLDESLVQGVARYGVWRFCFGDDAAEHEGLAGLREVASGSPASISGLKVRLAAGAPARLAYRSWARTYALSVARNRRQLLAKTAEFPYRALRELHRSGAEWIRQCKPLAEARDEKNRALTPISLARVGGRIARRAVTKALYLDQWSLAFRFGQDSAVPPDLARFTRIVPPRDRDWADPFALEKNGRYYVFFEELPYAAGKAHIAMLELDRSGRWSAPVRVLERDYHLSYPFLLEHEGNLYMVPESGRNSTIEVYRCVDFPLRWRLERVLLEGLRCVDATLHRSAERWWMFANGAAGDSRVFDDELHLFYADRLLGDWRAHPRNPVKSDARCARPAGALFMRNGALHRPAQICVPRYGAGLSINRVLRLTPHEYAERQTERFLPQGEVLGLHTVNRAADLTVVDIFRQRRRI
jgi:hypothetical protein